MHDGRRNRVRERFLNEGAYGFAPHELLELILFYAIPYKDTNETAHELINTFGSISGVLNADVRELQNVSGIGEKTAILLAAMLPLFKSYEKSKLGDKPCLKNRADMDKYCMWLLKYSQEECFYTICLDASYKVLGTVLIAKGTISEVHAYPRIVAEAVLRYKAQNAIICHNHPGGNCLPSNEDIDSTNTLNNLLSIMNINLIDHIIISQADVYSIKNKKLNRYNI